MPMLRRPCSTSGVPAIRRRAVMALLLVAVAGASETARGQGGWLPTSWFTAQPVDAAAMYPLAEKDGPWLVMASTFRGDGARGDARRLVHELRGKHKLQAYTHEKSFDYTGDVPVMGLNPDGTPKKMRYAKAEQVLEVAVLVGDFASFDDPRGQKMLAKIKGLHPVALTGESGKSRSFADFRRMIGIDGKGAKGPMHTAFVTPNPLLPEDYFTREQADEFVLRMNADVTHSLLDCPGRYSVRVATFAGSGTFDQKAIAGGAGEMPLESRLVVAAEQAHTLTVALRKQGWQAWEYHDRESSIVCVGSLDQIRVQQADGAVGQHPEITRIVAALGADPAMLAAGKTVARRAGGILLDVQPKPIQVPRAPANWR